jgi:hypothetical protein
MVSTDVKKYLEQGRVALDEATRKPLYAAVGATDKLYAELVTQLKDWPAEAQTRLAKLQEAGTAALSPAQLRQAVEQAAGQARETYGVLVSQAVQTYESLAHDGELAVRRLRRRPEVKSAFDRTEEVLDQAGAAVADAEDTVTRPAAKPRTAPARKAPAARRTTTRNAKS